MSADSSSIVVGSGHSLSGLAPLFVVTSTGSEAMPLRLPELDAEYRPEVAVRVLAEGRRGIMIALEDVPFRKCLRD
jgi:hypothetical protein